MSGLPFFIASALFAATAIARVLGERRALEASRDPEPVNEEFAAFLAEFAEVNLEASGVPEDERQMWRELR